MIIDKECEFSTAQRVCNSGATEASENYYNTGVTAANIGKGEPIQILCTVTEAFTGTGTTLTVTVQECDTYNGSYADVVGASSGAIAKATLVAGYQFLLTVPPIQTEQFLQLMYTGDNTFETTGKMTAHVVRDFQTNRTW